MKALSVFAGPRARASANTCASAGRRRPMCVSSPPQQAACLSDADAALAQLGEDYG